MKTQFSKKSLTLLVCVLLNTFAWSQNPCGDTTMAEACGYTPAWNAAANNLYYSSIGTAQIPVGRPAPTVQYVPQDSFPADSIVRCGMFRLYYEDFMFNQTPSGFLNPVFGQDAQNTMCAVLTYIQNTFTIQDTIDLYIEQSYAPFVHPAPAQYSALAAAGPYYVPGTYGITPGIYAGNFYTHANTGVDPDPNNYDAHIIVNFDQYYIAAYNAYYPILYQNNHTQPSTCRYDLFTTLLHEVGHAMGWISSIREDNNSSNYDAIAGSGNDSCFTLYDWLYLYYGDIQNPSGFQKIVVGTQASPYIDPAINLNPEPLNSNKIWLYSDPTPVNQPVYAGVVDPSFGVARASYMSHLNYNELAFDGMSQYSPGFRPRYVMGPFLPENEMKREFTLQELRALNTLGYTYTPTFAASFSLNSVERNDALLLGNEPPYRTDLSSRVSLYGDYNYDDHIAANATLTNNNTPINTTLSQFTFDITQDATFNDNNGDPISIMPGSLFGLRGVSLNGNNHGRLQINSTNTQITYTPEPGFWGRAQFAFYLWDGRERGAFEIYTVEVLPGSYAPPFGGELVINGNFEDGTEVFQSSGNTQVQNQFLYWDYYEGMAFQGYSMSGAHPHTYASNWWIPSAGGFIVGGQSWHCNQINTNSATEAYGSRSVNWDFFYDFHPVARPDTIVNERYAKIQTPYNPNTASIYCTLNDTVESCTQFRFAFDINHHRTTWAVGSPYTVVLSFISDPRNNPSSVTIYDTVHVTFTTDTLGPEHWLHVLDTVTYCGGVPVQFIGVTALAQFGNIYVQPVIDNISLRQIVPPAIQLVADQNATTLNPGTNNICLGDTVTLGAATENIKCNTTNYLWQPGNFTTATITVSPTVSTTYTLVVWDCADTSTTQFAINVLAGPTAFAGYDAWVCPGESVVIGEQQQPGVSISWSPSSMLNNDTVQNPLASITLTTTYTLTVTDGNGCIAQDTVTVNQLSANSIACKRCLVPNGEFEYYNQCPTGISQLSNASTWSWATLGSADYDHVCASVATGVNVPNNSIFGTVTPMISPPGFNAYAGIRTYGTGNSNVHEYMQTKLNCQLDSGQRYTIGFYTRVAPNCVNGYNNIGMYLSANPAYAANSSLPLNLMPQINRTTPIIDADGWTLVADTLYGNNERYITIGNFYDDASTTSANNGTGGTLPFGYYFVDNVYAKPIPPDVSADYTTVCQGQCVTLSATGSPSYTWTDGVNTYLGSSVVVCPATTTTYTCTAVLNCGNCDPVDTTITITVGQAPQIDAGNDTVACAGSTIQLQATATGAVSYLWLPATGLNSDTISNPVISSYNGAAITYTLVVTDALGCSATDSITIAPDPACCTAQNYTPDTLTNVTLTGGTWAVNSTLYINGTVTFNGVDMRIAAGVAIVELPSSTLYVTGQSHLYACHEMWLGIQEDANSATIVDSSSLIEDAYSAIRTANNAPSTTVCHNAIFNRNYNDVEVQPYSGTVALSLTNCRFTSRQLPASPTAASLTGPVLTGLPSVNLKAPLSGMTGFTAVNTNGAGQVNVGAASPNSQNIMDNLEHGIYGGNSNVTYKNNVFQNMAGWVLICPPSGCPPKPGIAVMLSDSTIDLTDPTTYNTVIGGGAELARNYFYNCYQAVDVSDYVYHSITNDTIYSSATTTAPPAINNLNGVNGIFIRTRLSLDMDIRLNSLVNQATPIHVMLANGGASHNSLHINGNRTTAQQTTTTFTNNGILVEGSIGVLMNPNNYIFVDSNTVWNAQNCINVRNFPKCQTVIENNVELFIRPSATQAAGPNSAGIIVTNMNKAIITGNGNIHSTGTTYSNPNHANIRGVYVVSSTAVVSCNVTHHTGQSYVFDGSCFASMWKKNDMSFSYDGFVMRNNAVIGPQGNSTHPIDNRWLGGAGSFVHAETYTFNMTNVDINSPIWVRPSGSWFPTNNLSSALFQEYHPNPVGSSFIAASCPAPTIGEGNPNMAAVAKRIAQDEVGYVEYPEETRVDMQKRLYSDLQEDSTMFAGDTVLQNFSATNQNTSIGLMEDVEKQAGEGNLASAAGSNSAIFPETVPEANQQQLNAILLNTVMIGQLFSTQQLADIWAIALQCPEQGGKAVWEARSTLNWVLQDAIEFTDSCAPSSARIARQEHISGINHLTDVYPNPNAGNITVNYTLHNAIAARFEVCDVTGRVLFSVLLDPQDVQKQIQLTGLANGAYMYKIIADENMVSTGTLILNR